MDNWPHQDRALRHLEQHRPGQKVVMCGPTGSGKSRVMYQDIARFDGPTMTIVHRKLLYHQLCDGLARHGVRFGGIAADDPQRRNLAADHQVGMVATLQRRFAELDKLPPIKRLFVDEAHVNKAGYAASLIRHVTENGGDVYGFTATPVGLGTLYDDLFEFASRPELRECGALIPALVYAPDEPHLPKIEKVDAYSLLATASDDDDRPSPAQQWLQAVVGRIVENYERLQKEHGKSPAIAFAPGVKESLWLAREFESAGYRAAHIDGSDCYIDGELIKTTQEDRASILEQLSRSDVDIVVNRFVLREGVDVPELGHCILATPIGGISAYTQIVGRVLRSHPSLEYVVIQDHGGNWHRHGSPNDQQFWSSVWDLNEQQASTIRQDRIKDDPGSIEITCPACGLIRRQGRKCPRCAEISQGCFRRVIQRDGSLKEMKGCPYRRPPSRTEPDTVEKWKACFYSCKKKKKSLSQAYGWFQHLHGYRPPRDLPLMPKHPADWKRPAHLIPAERLY